jgi:DNA-binding GntR family transcriptional regulator
MSTDSIPDEVVKLLPRQLQVDEIAHALQEDIIFGRLAPGARLVEDQLMARFAATRHFTRQALGELERLGIAVREKNKGVSVRILTPSEVRQIYEVRELLQRQAALRIPLPAAAALIGKLEFLHEDYLRFLAERDFGAVHECNDAFHMTMIAACGNDYLVESIKHYMRLSLPVRSTKTVDVAHAQKSAGEHYMMIQALKGTDGWALAQLCVDHLQSAKNDYLRDREGAGVISPPRTPRRRIEAVRRPADSTETGSLGGRDD